MSLPISSSMLNAHIFSQMELLLTPIFGSIKRYHRRKIYHWLNGTKTDIKVVRGGGNQRRGWRIKIVPKLHLKICSPLKLLTKLKNAYINMMLRLAGNVGSLNNENVFGSRRMPKARQVQENRISSEEVETRLVYEIYKVLAASRELSGSS